MHSVFSNVPLAPVIETYKVTETYNQDDSVNKVNLDMLGTIRIENNRPYVMPVVTEVEKQISNSDSQFRFEYYPTLGDPEFSACSARLLFGESLFSQLASNKQLILAQTVGATSALKIGGEFLFHHCNKRTVLLSKQTWGNHKNVFQQSGFTDIREFEYYDYEQHTVNFDKMVSDLQEYPEGSVIILHACCHNPSGADLSKDQWIKLEQLCKKAHGTKAYNFRTKRHSDLRFSPFNRGQLGTQAYVMGILFPNYTVKQFLPFFDACYLGLATGDIDQDAWPVRYFVERGHDILCAQSFAKIFTLYNERVGNLSVILNDKSACMNLNVERQLTHCIRKSNGTPNNHGSSVVKTILNDPVLKRKWLNNLKEVYLRLQLLKHLLVEKVNVPQIYHVTKAKGMFAYLGLSKTSIERLRDRRHIYIQNDGRINFFALNETNVDYVALGLAEEYEDAKNSNKEEAPFQMHFIAARI